MKIDVTEMDIFHGELGHCGKCPVALAISRLLKDGYYAKVHTTWLYICNKYHEAVCSFRVPFIAAAFIRKFDSSHLYRYVVQPFSFELELPTNVLKEKQDDAIS